LKYYLDKKDYLAGHSKSNNSVKIFRALIVDDIENSRITLSHDLQEYCPQIQIVGEADSVKSALDEINTLKPEVVFLDIQMGDGTGFDLLTQLKEVDFQIIFTTALDSYGIKAIKFSALDYLLKPIDPDELVKAVAKLGQSEKNKTIQDSIHLLIENMKGAVAHGNKRIAIHSLEKVNMIDIDNIIRCESQGAYTIFHLKQKEQILATKNLKEFEELLEPHSFIRVHHSHLINFAYLKEYVKKDGGYAVMVDKSEVPVSFRKRSTLLDMIDRGL
jgi:two-component system, LytTR family, response regulator